MAPEVSAITIFNTGVNIARLLISLRRVSRQDRLWEREYLVWPDRNASRTEKQVHDVWQAVGAYRDRAALILMNCQAGVQEGDVRAALLTPEPKALYGESISALPGDLKFRVWQPEAAWSNDETQNRFAPGEGVTGRIFLAPEQTYLCSHGTAGVSPEMRKRMRSDLRLVWAWPIMTEIRRRSVCTGAIAVDLCSRVELSEEIQSIMERALGASDTLKAQRENVSKSIGAVCGDKRGRIVYAAN